MSTATYTQNEQREKVIHNFLPLVNYIVGRMAINIPSFLDTEDLVEAGIIGLIGAVDSYNPNMGTSLKTYAFTKIRGAILDELRKISFFPRSFNDKLKKFRIKYEKLEEELGYLPSLDDLAENFSMSHEEVNELLMALRGVTFLSINQGASTCDEDKGFLAILKSSEDDPAKFSEQKELKEELAKAISLLPERERQVIVLYYYEGLMLKEISQVLEVSPSRVSHLHARAIYQLNQYLRKAQ